MLLDAGKWKVINGNSKKKYIYIINEEEIVHDNKNILHSLNNKNANSGLHFINLKKSYYIILISIIVSLINTLIEKRKIKMYKHNNLPKSEDKVYIFTN